MDKLIVFVPAGDGRPWSATRWPRRAPGAIGDYDHCTFSTPGEGRFRPLEGADPTIGAVGSVEVVDEVRVEVGAAAAVGVPTS